MMHPFYTSHAPLRLSCSDWCICALCRFAGSSVLEEDRASRRLEVDEQGLPRRVSTDIWSATTSVSPSRAVSTATSRAASRFALVALLHPCPHLHAHLHLRLLFLLVLLSCMQNCRRRWSLDLPVVSRNKSFMVLRHIDSPLGAVIVWTWLLYHKTNSSMYPNTLIAHWGAARTDAPHLTGCFKTPYCVIIKCITNLCPAPHTTVITHVTGGQAMTQMWAVALAPPCCLRVKPQSCLVTT